jgi:NAD(P) transhydrogenase subunit beta
MNNISEILYLIAGVCFILAIKGLASPKTARNGNILGIVGMVIGVITTMKDFSFDHQQSIVGIILIGGAIGATIALKIKMTAMPQLVAAFHSLVGMAAVLVASAAFYAPDSFGIGAIGNIHSTSLIEMSLGVVIGAITFSGSIIAFLKLQGIMGGSPIRFTGQHAINAIIALTILYFGYNFYETQSAQSFNYMIALGFLLGFLLIIPIGGADMPVVISMLNSYSGWAAAGIGFTLGNSLLIITGALVGASGAILSYVMCKGMNRSIINVIFGGFGSDNAAASTASHGYDMSSVKSASGEDAGFILQNAQSIIIVPGYGMAVAQAQHALKEMADLLQKKGIKVRYAIHPVAGRMPGHMNVLLAEANVPYDQVFELSEINRDFTSTDIAFVIGANDITNPAAKTDTSSPIYGMPILDVEKAGQVLFLKRGMAPGYAGVENELFFRDNTIMLFGDAKQTTESIVKALEEL